MDLTQLRYFQAVAEAGSITAAAHLLGITQPTLTAAIQQMEKRLGTKLLLRGRSGIQLTATGEALRRHAAAVHAQLDQAEQEIRALQDEEVGNFVLGCHESLGAYFLPSFLPFFLRTAPRISLTLWNGASSAVRDAVADRKVHFGLVVNPRPHPDLVFVPLFHDAMDVFVAAEGAPAEGDVEAAHARLRTGPLIYAPRVLQCQELLERLAAKSLLPERLLPCGDLELVKSLALSGLGVALLPRRVAAYWQQGRLRRLHPALPYFEDTITLLYHSDGHRTRAARRLKEALVEHGHKLEEETAGAR
jgi:DNA-binding transcriptional LysR family regulator